MYDLREFFFAATLVVGGVLAAILYLSGVAGISFSLAADLFGRAVAAVIIVSLGGWRLLRGRSLNDTLLALLPALAGGLWVALWPLWDARGRAAAGAPSALAYPGAWTDRYLDLPWYATTAGQWSILVACAAGALLGWWLGRD